MKAEHAKERLRFERACAGAAAQPESAQPDGSLCAALQLSCAPPSKQLTAAVDGGYATRPVQPQFRVLVCAAPALNAAGQSRVTLSLRQARLRAACLATAGGKFVQNDSRRPLLGLPGGKGEADAGSDSDEGAAEDARQATRKLSAELSAGDAGGVEVQVRHGAACA